METGIIKLSPELLAFIGSGGVNALSPFTREIFLIELVVSGTSFCKTIDDIAPLLVVGEKLLMLRDPENQHDEMAIGLYHNKTRIGWVPMEQNEVISRLMDAGKAFFCRVTNVKKKGKWNKITVNIFMVE